MSQVLTQEQVVNLVRLKDSEGQSFRDLARLFGVAVGTVHKAYWTFKQDQGVEEVPPSYAKAKEEEVEAIDGMTLDPSVKATQEGPNQVTLDSKSDKIVTLEQLLDYCQVDLEVWEVRDYRVNAWPGWARHEQKDLTYEDGRATGHIWASGELIQETLIQVKANLIRRTPIAVLPEIKAAPQFEINPPDPPKGERGRVYRALVSGDWQLGFERDPNGSYMTPFHDRRYLDLLLQVAAIMQPDRVVLLGDLVDLPEWSKNFRKRPGFYWTTQPTIFELNFWLSQLRAILPDAAIDYLAGNHEDRLPNAIIDYLPALYQLRPADIGTPVVDFSYLFGLKGLGINYQADYPDSEVWLGPNVVCGHGNLTRGKPGLAASTIATGSLVTVIYGHGHKLELVGSSHKSGLGEVMVEAASPGCGCRLDYVTPGHKRGQDWRQGLLEVQYTMDGDHVIIPLSVREGTMLYDGEVLRARPKSIERLPELYPQWAWTNPKRLWWE